MPEHIQLEWADMTRTKLRGLGFSDDEIDDILNPQPLDDNPDPDPDEPDSLNRSRR